MEPRPDSPEARALCGNDEKMFSVPRDKIAGFVASLRDAQESYAPFVNENMMMRSDFPQPELYKNVFKAWGMDTEEWSFIVGKSCYNMII